MNRKDPPQPDSSPIVCAPSDFLKRISELKQKGAALSSICAYPDDGDEVALSYFFELSENLIVVKVSTSQRCIDSLFSLYANSDFIEREASKLYRIKFLGHPNLSALKTQGKIS